MDRKLNYAWWIFFSTCLMSMIGFGLIVNTVGLFFEPIGQEFDIGRAQVAMMVTFQNIACAITLLFAGKIIERFSLKWILTICYLIIGLGLLSLYFSKAIIQFYVVWAFIGICQPFAITLSIPVLLDNWFYKKLGTVMGIALGVSAIGGTIFNIIVSTIITVFGWRIGWIAEGLIVLLILVPVSLFIIKVKPAKGQKPYGFSIQPNEKLNEEMAEKYNTKRLLTNPMFLLLSFAMIALQFVSGFIQHISAYIVNIGFSLNIGATVVSAVMLGAAIGKILIGILLDKFDTKLVIVGYSLIGIIGWSGLLARHNSVILLLSGLILGMGQGVVLVAVPFFVRKEFGSNNYSYILSLINIFGSISTAVAVSLDGKFYDIFNSYSVPLLINVLMYFLSGIAIVRSILYSCKYLKRPGD